MTRWAMVADLERCVGCQTCTAACRHTNATSPAVQWRKVLDIEAGAYPNVSRTFVPVGCQHCADPPCMHVCPSTATRRRPDGIVTIDYDICIGCAYCDVACPYQARFKVDAPRFAYPQREIENEIEREDPGRIGVAQKCTFCSDRIDFGLANGLTPGQDPRATPACVNACIADALHFGDLDDPDSNVSHLLREQQSFRMHAELGTEPGFHYVYGEGAGSSPLPMGERVAREASRVRGSRSPIIGSESPSPQPSPTQVGPARPAHESIAELGQARVRWGEGVHLRTRGVEPWHQQHWDWKAAANFICGGAGSGLFFFAALASLRQGQPGALFPLGPVALAIVALGLLLLLFKIGRPLRFLNVLRQPQRSWMTREAWIVGVFFPLAAAAMWFAAPILTVAAALVGLIFLFSQAMILKEAKGIPAWRIGAVVPLIVATGLAEGSGLFLAATSVMPTLNALAAPAAIAAVLLAGLRGWTWYRYRLALACAGAPTRALAVLGALSPRFILVGLVVPVVLIAAGFVAASAQTALFALAGAGVALAGSALKLVLVTRAGFNQGFALEHTPVRGAGSAGPAVKPGWSWSQTNEP